jgi:hypothetical protein
MTTPSVIRGNQLFYGRVTFGGPLWLPPNTVDNDHISSDPGKRIAASKLIHRLDITGGQPDGQDVASETRLLRIVRGAAELLSFTIRPTTLPSGGGDKEYTVDLQAAANASNSWTSLLDAAVLVDALGTVDQKIEATLATTPTLAAGGALRLVVTASGTTGNQGQGFAFTAAIAEAPD